MIQFLYKNFLQNKRTYNLNEGYYAKLLEKISQQKTTPFFKTQFRNGEKFYDGNPIFSTCIGNRILRIIQEEPTSQSLFITAWVKAEDGLHPEELVVSLELSKETKYLLEKLLTKWVVEKADKTAMEKYIETLLPDNYTQA